METAGKPTTFFMHGPNGSFQVCVKRDRYLGSLGVWVGDNPFDFVVPLTLFQIMMTVIVTRVLCYVLKPLKTPRFTCSVLVSFVRLKSFTFPISN